MQRPVTCWGKEIAQWNDWHTVLADTDLSSNPTTTSSSSSSSSSSSAASAAAAGADLSTPPQAVAAAAILDPQPLSSTQKVDIKSSKTAVKKGSELVLVSRPRNRNFQTRYWRWNGWLCR